MFCSFIDGKKMEVKAAMSETLPMDMLLGKDIPEFYDLLSHMCGREVKTSSIVERSPALDCHPFIVLCWCIDT